MLTQEQVRERTGFIGGSDAAAVLGLSRWATPLSVWASKTGQIPDEDKSDCLAIEVGNELEDLVAKLFAKKTGKKVHRVNEAIFHPEYPFIGGFIDRKVTGEDAILECKTASGWKAKEWDGEDIPREYIIQVMHYLAVTGQQRAYIACLIGGNQKFVWKTVERDEDMIKSMISREVAFWREFVEPKIMPTTVTARDGETLYNLFPLDDQTEVELTDEANKLCESIGAMVADKKKLDSQIDQAKNELRLMLGEHAIGKTDSYKVTWKTCHKEEYKVPARDERALRISKIKQETK